MLESLFTSIGGDSSKYRLTEEEKRAMLPDSTAHLYTPKDDKKKGGSLGDTLNSLTKLGQQTIKASGAGSESPGGPGRESGFGGYASAASNSSFDVGSLLGGNTDGGSTGGKSSASLGSALGLGKGSGSNPSSSGLGGYDLANLGGGGEGALGVSGLSGAAGSAGSAASMGDVMGGLGFGPAGAAQEAADLGMGALGVALGDPEEYNYADMAMDKGVGYGGGTLSGAKLGSVFGPIGTAVGAGVGLGGDIASHFWLGKVKKDRKKRKDHATKANLGKQKVALAGQQLGQLGGLRLDMGESSALQSIFGGRR